MDTTVVWCCPKRWANIGFVIMTSFLFFSCPSEDQDCNDLGSIARLDDLITLLHKQTHYNVDDTLSLKVSIPSDNNYYNHEVNLFQATNDYSALLTFAFENFFINNSLTFIKGSQGENPNWFNMPYNSDNQMYELEILISFENVGDYYLITDDNVYFQGDDYCNRFRIDTNIEWFEPGPGIIEFTVTE